MLDRVKRILNVKELQANVMEFKAKEEEERKAEMERHLLEISDFLEATQKEIIEASKRGETQYRFVRYEDGYNKAFSEEIKKFFEEQGFNVSILINVANNYNYQLGNPTTFFGLGSFSVDKRIKYTFIISWREEK